MTREIWKQFRDTRYFVSSQGRVRGCNGRIMRPLVEKARGGYLSIILCHDGQKRRAKVSRMVCEAFKGPPPTPQHEADHRDKDRTNNWARNLRWLTVARNRAARDIAKGERGGNAILSPADVLAIRASRLSNIDVAEKFGISRRHANQIRSKKRWKHL